MVKHNKKNSLVYIDSAADKILEKDDYIFVTEFNDASLKDFFVNFTKMDSDPDFQVIPVVVSSFGGQVHSLLPMLDLIASASKPVATIGLGKAMSCGAILLSAGTKGYRFAGPSTDIMIHEVSSMDWGKNLDIQNSSKHLRRLNKQLFDHLQKQSNIKGRDKILNDMKAMGNVDWYLTAEEYKKMGLIDHITVPKLLTR